MNDSSKSILLILSILNNNTEVLKVLIDAGAYLNTESIYDLQHGYSILNAAIEMGNMRIISNLIENGIRLKTTELKDWRSRSPMGSAIFAKHLDVVKLLLLNG